MLSRCDKAVAAVVRAGLDGFTVQEVAAFRKHLRKFAATRP
jgi:hypothetical protein